MKTPTMNTMSIVQSFLPLLLLSLANTVKCKDPLFAVPLEIPTATHGTSPTHTHMIEYKVVSLLWLSYLKQFEGENRYIFLNVVNYPYRLKVNNRTILTHPSDKMNMHTWLTQTARTVLLQYVKGCIGEKDVYILNGVDQTGVNLVFRNGRRRYNISFNRTINIDFADPPYGQTLANRLVTNRKIDWTISVGDLVNFDGYRKVDKSSLLYRYYHNIGHLLGLGHFIRHMVETKRIFKIDQSTLKSIISSLASVNMNWQRMVDNKSVMFANVSAPLAHGTITRLDTITIYHVYNNLHDLLRQAVDKVVRRDIPALLRQIAKVTRFM